jgi:hypothetical protein
MTSFIILAILVALLIWVLMQLSKKKNAPEPLSPGVPKPDLANLKVTDARAGDMISISGAGDDFSDLDFNADHYTRFDAGAHPWVELSGPYRERRVSLRVAGDEDIEAAVHNDPRPNGRAPEHRRLFRIRWQSLALPPQPRGACLARRPGPSRGILLLGIL